MTPAARERRQVELPVLLITMAAWVALFVRPGAMSLSNSCCIPSTLQEGLSTMSLQMLMSRNPPSTLATGWLLMLVAMMTPLLSAPIRHVMDRTLARRRSRSVLLFVAGYVAVWMAAGVVLLSTALAVRLFLPTSLLPLMVGLLVTVLWQCSPWKQRCLNRGHAHPAIAGFGGAAAVDALRFGLTHGLWCVGSCWALMLLPELFPLGHIPAMAVMTVWMIAEKLDRPSTPRWQWRGTGKATRIFVAQARMLMQRG